LNLWWCLCACAKQKKKKDKKRESEGGAAMEVDEEDEGKVRFTPCPLEVLDLGRVSCLASWVERGPRA
jgi:uncharacterized OsmC-like protein